MSKNIVYPTWKQKGYPTPNNLLKICDKCCRAVWLPDSTNQNYCCDSRMRIATKKEINEALKCLKEII